MNPGSIDFQTFSKAHTIKHAFKQIQHVPELFQNSSAQPASQ